MVDSINEAGKGVPGSGEISPISVCRGFMAASPLTKFLLPPRRRHHSTYSARYSKLTFTTELWASQRPKMWLDGDPKLLAYFFLYEASGIMLTLLLISFGATKGTRRYAYFFAAFRRTDHISFPGCQNSW